MHMIIQRNRFHLDSRPFREIIHSYRTPRRLVREEACVNPIDRLKILHIFKEDRRLHHAFHPGSSRNKDMRDVLAYLSGLVFDRFPKLHGLRVKSDLPRAENERSDGYRLRIGTYRLRSLIAVDMLHGKEINGTTLDIRRNPWANRRDSECKGYMRRS